MYYGSSFVFDDTPCELYDLMIYDIDGQDEDITVSGVSQIEDESIGDNWKPYFYGTRPGEKLEFDITFGVNERRLDSDKYLDSWELAEVASWLCGHKGYKWLFIDQPGAELYGYHCIITELHATRFGSVPWALKAHITCDSPYAYLEAKEMTYDVNGSKTIEIYNESSLNDWYYPEIKFKRRSGTAFSIQNERDGESCLSLTNIPGNVTEIFIDNQHCVVDNDAGRNLYEGFNFRFFRLAKGYNTINITGDGIVIIKCQYPINVGG